jgi:hypothetical protein
MCIGPKFMLNNVPCHRKLQHQTNGTLYLMVHNKTGDTEVHASQLTKHTSTPDYSGVHHGQPQGGTHYNHEGTATCSFSSLSSISSCAEARWSGAVPCRRWLVELEASWSGPGPAPLPPVDQQLCTSNPRTYVRN